MAEFAERGFKGATMRGIARAAGVSLGLVQHHFGTKDGLRRACDDRVMSLVDTKVQALDEGRLGDPQVLSGLRAMAPLVQSYVARALVDRSEAMSEVIDQAVSQSEQFLTSHWPDRFPADETVTSDAGAVMTVINTSIMVLQPLLSERMGIEPYSELAVMRIGSAMLDVFEAMADFVNSDTWRDLRAGIATIEQNDEEQDR